MITMTNWQLCVPDADKRIGYEGETKASRLTIQLDQTFDGWQFKLDVQRPGGRIDVWDLIREGDTVYVEIIEQMCLGDGPYRVQLRGINGDQRQMSNIVYLYVGDSVQAIEAMDCVPLSELYQLEARLTAIKTDVEQMAGNTSADAQTATEAAQQAVERAEQALQSATQAANSASEAAASATASTEAKAAAQTAGAAAQQALQDAQSAMTAAQQAMDAAQAAATQAHNDAVQTAADRVQTGLDRQASESAATQTAADHQAVSTDKQVVQDAAATFTGQTVPDATQALNTQRDAALADITTQRDTSVQAVNDAGQEQIAAINALDVYTKQAVDALLSTKADQPYTTATGETIAIADSAGGAVQLEISGKSVQDGTPSPDAPVAINSVTSPVGLSVDGTDYSIPLLASDRVTYPDPLELRSVGDVRDAVKMGSDGRYKVVRRVIKKIYDGSNANWAMRDTPLINPVNKYFVDKTTTDTGLMDPGISICTHFAWVRRIYYEDIIGIHYEGSAAASEVRIRAPQQTVADFNAWLAAQYGAGTPVTVCYQRATPVEIDLSDETQSILRGITIPKGTANIWTTNTIKPTLSLTYRQDLAAYIHQVMDSMMDTVATNQVDMDARISALELTGGQ